MPPTDVAEVVANLKTAPTVWIDSGAGLLFSQAPDNDLFLILASAKLQGEPGPLELRPDVLDAQRKRFLPSVYPGGSNTDANKVPLKLGG